MEIKRHIFEEMFDEILSHMVEDELLKTPEDIEKAVKAVETTLDWYSIGNPSKNRVYMGYLEANVRDALDYKLRRERDQW